MTPSMIASLARAGLLAAALSAATVLGPSVARAFDTEANVDDVRDLPDPSPNVGACASTAGTCTLRAAIMRANKRTGQHVIRVPAGTYTLTRAGREEDDAETGDLDVRRDTTITGAGAGVTIIDAAFIDRVFDLSGKRNITIKDLTIRGGEAESVGPEGRDGAGIRIGYINGGDGNVKLIRVVIEDNFGNGSGAGIAMRFTRSLRIERSAIVNNNLDSTATGIALATFGGEVTISDTTISGNIATRVDRPLIDIGGATNATIRRSTIVGQQSQRLIVNTFPGGGASRVDIGATLLQGVGTSCDRINGLVVFDSGNNVEQGDTCGLLEQKANLIHTPLQLGALTRTGGTVFHSLPRTSPAIDHIPVAACGTSTDQRGLPRPRAGRVKGDASCDVGAIEVQGTRGEPGVTATQSDVRRAGDPFDLAYSWRVPDGGSWQDLATLDLKLRDAGRIVLWVRWFEDDDRFVELSATGEPIGAGGASFKPGFVLDEERAAALADGPDSPEVTLHLPLLAVRARHGGGLTAEVSATDDDGATQPFSSIALLGDGGGATVVPRLDGRLPVSR